MAVKLFTPLLPLLLGWWLQPTSIFACQADPATSPDIVQVPADTGASAAIVEDSTQAVDSATPSPSDKIGAADMPDASQLTDGQVLLLFRNQKWLPALEWLAQQRKMNLDWQTLPEGEFSLYSSQPYALEEAEDLINMQLLARGFTLLAHGEVLRVVPLKEVDITLVPRVEVDALEQMQPHSFVRVSFPLTWMMADEAVDEFKPLVSPYGTLSAMRSSNRLEAMDAVVNLRELHLLLTRAEDDDARRERVAEFKLKFRRAEDVAVKVRQLLGLPEAAPPTSTMTQLDIEQAKFKAEAIKQMGVGARELIKDKKIDIFLTVNDKENSILVNAPPNKIEIVRQAIEALDKELPEQESTWNTLSRVKLHDVEGFEPKAITNLLASLQEQGNLSKDARIQYEAAYNRIIAFASAEDHLTISQVIESFRAKRRSAAVVPLGDIDPDYAVSAIQLILKNPQRPPAAPGVASDGTFQVEADPDHDRLLLWASDEELKEVREFLATLGESAGPSATNSHVLNLNGADLREVSDRLQRVWKDVSDSPLIVEPLNQPNEPEQPAGGPIRANTSSNEVGQVRPDPAARQSQVAIRLISSSSHPSSEEDHASEQSQTPVRLIEGRDGELLVLSRDLSAADQVRKLLEAMLPEPSSVAVIPLIHAQANIIKRQLEELLQEETTVVPASSSTAAKLAKRSPPIKIDPDARTNRVIIRNASDDQLKRIRQLVEVLDQPVAADDRLVRQQRIYRFKYRKAEEVATVIKEVYRDLLSINDRVFASSTSSNSRGSYGYNQNLAATASNPEYQGLLSLGSDPDANLLIVSAPSYLIEEIMQLVESVDTPDDGTTVSVIGFEVNGTKDSMTQEALSRLLQGRRR